MSDAPLTPVARLLIIRDNALVRGATSGSAALAELLTRLQVPASFLGGRRVAGQACSLLRKSLHTQPVEARPKIREYICELRWILHHAERLGVFLFDSEEERKRFLCCSGGNPFVSGGARDHGLCCLLWERYSKSALLPDNGHPNLRQQFDALRLEALLAHIAALGYWAHRVDWLSPEGPGRVVRESMYRRTLAIRHFTMNRYRASTAFRSALAKIPLMVSRAQLQAALRQIRRDLPVNSDTLEEQLKEDLASILGMLKVADKPDSLRDYTSEEELETAGVESPAPHEEVDGAAYQVECFDDEGEGDEADDPGDDQQDGESADDGDDENGDADATGVTYTRSRWSEEEKKNCMNAGVNPADVLPVQNLHLSTRRKGDGNAWQAMQNQNLSFAWRNLAIEELGIGLQILESQADRSLGGLEIFALAKFIVARGLTLSTAQSMEVRSDRPSEVNKLTLFLPDDELGHAEWLLPAVPISYEQEHGDYEGCRRVRKFFVASDYWGIGNVLRRLLVMKFPGWKGEPLQPFAMPVRIRKHPKTYSLRLKYALEHSNSDRGPGLGGRVTFVRLGRVLRQRINDQTAGNLVLVTYISLQKERAGEDGRFYATPAVRSIQQAELAAVSTLDAELRVIGYDALVDLTLKPSDSSGYLGSPMCPTLEAVEKFLAKLVAIIAAANDILNTRDDIKAIIARHNAFTLLTFCAVTLGTCHRPTHGGVPDLSAIDTSNGRVSVADKGSAKARLGVAADLSVSQLRVYHEYVKTFEWGKHFGALPELPLFLISPDSEFLAISPATLEQQSLPFVANFARHLAKAIFSEWCEAGDERLSQEWISALLGHCIEGEEQFGPHSSFDYRSFSESMHAALGSLLESVKFQPIDILGRKVVTHAPQIQHFLQSTEA